MAADLFGADLNMDDAKRVLADLLKTENGRKMADEIRGKLTDLNEQYKGLEGDEKQKFIDGFKDKFRDALSGLKVAVANQLDKAAGGDGSGETPDFVVDPTNAPPPPTPMRYSPTPNYTLFLIAFLFVVVVFG